MRTLKVGRFTLGLVLVITGIAIVVELYTDLVILDSLIRVWPMAIILLGIEYLYVSQRPEVRTMLSTSSIVLIAITLVSASVYNRANSWFWPDSWVPFSRISQPYAVTFPIDEPFGTGITRLEIQATGDVLFTGTDTDRVTGTITLNVRGRSPSEARRAAERFIVERARIGNTLIIRVPKPSGIPERISVLTSANLYVPSYAHVKSDSVSGFTEIENVSGDVEVNTVSGSVTIDENPSSIIVDSVSGNVEVVLSEDMTSVNLKTVTGSIDIVVPQGTGGTASINTVSGNIRVGETGLTVERRPGVSEAKGSFGEGNTNVSVHSISGNVTFR
jgi:hypothetical protein